MKNRIALRAILLGILILGLLGLAAALVGGGSRAALVAAVAPATPTPAPPAVDAAAPIANLPSFDPSGEAPVPPQEAPDLIANAQSEALARHPFHANIDVTMASGNVMTATMEYAPVGRIHASLPTGADVLILSDEGTVYQRDHGGPWIAMPGQLALSLVDAADFLNPKRIEALRGQLRTEGVQYAGTDSIDGIRTWIYQYQKSDTILGQQTQGAARIWIGQGDRLVHRLETVSDAVPGAGQLQIAVQYTYDPNIRIEAP